MSLAETEVLSPAGFDQLELDRSDALSALLEFARAHLAVVAALRKHAVTLDLRHDWSSYATDHAEAVDKVMKRVDSKLWTEAIAAAGVDSVMTAQDARLMRDKVEAESPPFTAKEARRLVDSLIVSAGELAMSSVRQVFDRLVQAEFRRGGSAMWRQPRERQNAREIEKTFRLTLWWSGIPDYWYRSDDTANALLNDLEMACCLVNDQPRPKYPDRIADRMMVAYREGGVRLGATPHFCVELFRNGNAIIRFTCDATLVRLNAWGADGRAVAGTASEG